MLGMENFDNEKTHFSVALTPRSPRLDYAIQLTRALLAEMAEVARENGTAFVVFYVDSRPHQLLPESPTPFEVGGRTVFLSSDAQRAAAETTLKNFSSFVLTGYRKDFRISAADGHLNDEGNRYFMIELAKRLAQSLGS
jgi:hypothetical protein